MPGQGSLLDQYYRAQGQGQSAVASGSLAELEDVEMSWNPEERGQLHYICIDTNVLLARLDLIKRLYLLLTAHTDSNISLLIPHRVLRELDTRGSAETGLTSDQARAATAWLLKVIRRVMLEGVGAIRHQKSSERKNFDPTLDPDDLILDCCLYFVETSEGIASQGVTLWTNDKNLTLRTLTEGLNAVGGPDATLRSVLEATRMHLTPALLNAIDPSLSHLPSPPWAGDMELDPAPATQGALAVSFAPPDTATTSVSQLPILPMNGTRLSHSARSPRPPPSAYTAPERINPSRSSSSSSLGSTGLSAPRLRQAPSPELLTRIAHALLPLATELPPLPTLSTSGSAQLRPDSMPNDILDRLIRHMSALYDHITAEADPTNEHAIEYKRTVSQCEAHFRRLRQFVDPPAGERRTRSGDAADALEELAQMLPEILQVDVEKTVALSIVAADVRNLD